MLLQLSAFHVYEEHENLDGKENHCEFCLLAIENQQLDSIIVYSPLMGDILIEPINQGTIDRVDSPVYLGHYRKEQLPRPPPLTL